MTELTVAYIKDFREDKHQGFSINGFFTTLYGTREEFAHIIMTPSSLDEQKLC